MNRTLKALVLSAGLCALPNLCFSANIVYDNTATDLSQQYFPTPNTLEFGDQISLVGSDRVLSQFNFYYFLSGTATGQSATVRMYANSGTNPPTSAFYASDPIPLAAGFNNQQITFNLASNLVTVPNSFTWTVQFSGLTAGQNAGLLLYGPPNQGSSFNDFWQKDGTGTWGLMQINGGATLADFAARVTAVPEPGVLALSGLGALVLAGLRRRRKAPQ